jgi:hypothetical protein
MIRGPMTCLKCSEKGHRQASSKCKLNGTAKKRQVLISFIYNLNTTGCQYKFNLFYLYEAEAT